MKKPWLIQRCELGGGKLVYDYMGSEEYDIGDQAKALKRIFSAGVAVGSCCIKVGGKEVPVFMVASKGFLFAEYQQYLQLLADHKLDLQEWTGFDYVVKEKAGFPGGLKAWFNFQLNAWFDFRNDVLWTLTEDDQKALVVVLEGIKKKWGDKK